MRWSLLFALAACGDNVATDEPQAAPDATAPLAPTCDETALAGTLRALPHVTAVAETPCGDFVAGTARCFGISFEQAVQHASPSGPSFQQRLFLVHRGCDRPTLVADWGYSNEYFFDDELSVLYRTNALWIEHRYQGASLPSTADWDWSALTIANGAADMHEIVAAFRRHYGAHFVSTGASKGGITASYHHFLYPHDLDGAIPYVAPASRSRVDPAYQGYLTINLPACNRQLRDAQVAALTDRRPMMQQRLIGFGADPGEAPYYLESMVAHLDWSFWQYYGLQYCTRVPDPTATDDAFWKFFADFSGFGFDAAGLDLPAGGEEERSWGALYYEWLSEQGFALQIGAHVKPHITRPEIMTTMEEDFHQMFPGVTLPAYDGTVTYQTRLWAREHANDLLLIYGQYDPWSGGAMDEPERSTSARFFVPNATHGAQIENLYEPDRIAALEHATRMFGVPPQTSQRAAAAQAGQTRHAILSAHDRRAMRRLVRRLQLPGN